MGLEWTAERIEELRRIGEKMSLKELGEHFGVSRCAIAGARHRYLHNGRAANPGFRRHAPAKPKTHKKFWTDDRLVTLRGLLEAGLQVGQIAEDMAASVSSVTKKARDLGFEPRGTDPGANRKRARRLAGITGPAPKMQAEPIVHETPIPAAEDGLVGASPKIWDHFQDGYLGQKGRLSILQLHHDACRYPITMASGETRYCGLGIARGVYCGTHADRCNPVIRERVRRKWGR